MTNCLTRLLDNIVWLSWINRILQLLDFCCLQTSIFMFILCPDNDGYWSKQLDQFIKWHIKQSSKPKQWTKIFDLTSPEKYMPMQS